MHFGCWKLYPASATSPTAGHGRQPCSDPRGVAGPLPGGFVLRTGLLAEDWWSSDDAERWCPGRCTLNPLFLPSLGMRTVLSLSWGPCGKGGSFLLSPGLSWALAQAAKLCLAPAGAGEAAPRYGAEEPRWVVA